MASSSDGNLRQKLSRCINSEVSYKDRRQALKTAFTGIQDKQTKQSSDTKCRLVKNGAIGVLIDILRCDSPTGPKLDKGVNIWDKKSNEHESFKLQSDAALSLRRMIEVGDREVTVGISRVQQVVAEGGIQAIVPHLYCLQCASGYASGALLELAQYECYRDEIIRAGALVPLRQLLEADPVVAKTSYRGSAECLHLLSCTSVDQFAQLGILDACLQAATDTRSGDKTVLAAALCAANITAGRDDNCRGMEEVYLRTQLGIHICRSLNASLTSGAPYLKMKWSQSDILNSIRLVAASDLGRRQLVAPAVTDAVSKRQLNIVDLLTILLSKFVASSSEQTGVILEILLHFAFCDKSGKLIRRNGECMAMLQSLSRTNNVDKCCNGDDDDGSSDPGENDENVSPINDPDVSYPDMARNILYLLKGDLDHVVVRSPEPVPGESIVVPSAPMAPTTALSSDETTPVQDNSAIDISKAPHVMISYSWAQQPIVLELCKHLRTSGVPYWLDVEQMHGNINDRMAEAIESCSAVIVVISNKYKLSANCRMEAEYSNACRKQIIPIMAEENYVADGWLGLLISGKLYYEMFNVQSLAINVDSVLQILKPLLAAALTAKQSSTMTVTTSVKPLSLASTADDSPGDHHSVEEVAVADTWPRAKETALEKVGDIDTVLTRIESIVQSNLVAHLKPVLDRLDQMNERLVNVENYISSNSK